MPLGLWKLDAVTFDLEYGSEAENIFLCLFLLANQVLECQEAGGGWTQISILQLEGAAESVVFTMTVDYWSQDPHYDSMFLNSLLPVAAAHPYSPSPSNGFRII